METKVPIADWLVLNCPSCQMQMKARREAVGRARMLCPGCREVISEPEGEGEIEEGTAAVTFSGSIPMGGGGIVAPRATPMRNADPEFVAQMPGVAGRDEEADDFLGRLHRTDGMEMPARIRVKKRRRRTNQSGSGGGGDWNEDRVGLPEAEVVGDPWLKVQPLPEEMDFEDERELMTKLPMRDGHGGRVRRMGSRHRATVAQMFFRRLNTNTRLIAGALCAVIVVGGTYYAWQALRHRWSATTYEAEASGNVPRDRGYLTMQDISGAEEVVRGYLAAESVEQQLAWVRLPKRVKPMMEAWEREHPVKPMKAGEVTNQNKIRSGEMYFVTLEVTVNEPDPLDAGQTFPRSRYFAVEEIEDAAGNISYRLDWETAVAHQEVPLEKFRESMSTKAVPFRLNMRESNYYVHGFTDETKWRCAELYYPGREEEFRLYGYIPVVKARSDRLLSLIEGGISSAVVVMLRYPENAESRDQVIIEDLVLPSWFYAEDRPPESAGSAEKP
jgi:hypothetical protein